MIAARSDLTFKLDEVRIEIEVGHLESAEIKEDCEKLASEEE